MRPHLMLHVDCNKTIIADDPTQGKSVEDVVNGLLAEKTVHRWTHLSTEPMSYYRFVHDIVHPGEKSDPAVKALRRDTVARFVQDLLEDKIAWPQETTVGEVAALKGRVRDQRDELMEKLDGVYVFPSFTNLLSLLREADWPHTVVLRTFGNDIKQIVPELEKAVPGVKFTHIGEIKSGTLTLENVDTKEKLVTDKVKDIYEVFKKAQYVAVRDDYSDWAKHKEGYAFGKRFPFDPRDSDTLSMFFDDNIELDASSPRNIIAPYDVNTGEAVSMETVFAKGQAIQADTLKAIQDANYFRDEVCSRIATHLCQPVEPLTAT